MRLIGVDPLRQWLCSIRFYQESKLMDKPGTEKQRMIAGEPYRSRDAELLALHHKAQALLDENPKPTEWEIREGIEGNICRCTGYNSIVRAIDATAKGEYK